MVDISIKRSFENFNLNFKYKSECKRIGILGCSGSGKTLTLKTIAGIEDADNGFIKIENNTLYDSRNKINLKPQKRSVGYLFQNYALFPNMTVKENILSGMKRDSSKNINNIIKAFRLEGLENNLPNQLSGGQQQRCALARIIANNPEAILLDEPFSALDESLKEELKREIEKILGNFKGTVIVVSHNKDEIYTMTDELIILDKGNIVEIGKTKEIFDNPKTIEGARLTGYSNISEVENKGNSIYIPLWDIYLPIKEDIKGVAIRAQQFNIKGGEYAFDVISPIISEDIYEYNISFKASNNSKERINWKISKFNMGISLENIPKRVYLDENSLIKLYK